jgi:hypothetical protein
MTIHPFFPLKANLLHVHVIYPGAVIAEEVMMGLGFIVVMGLIALYGYLLNEPMFFKEIEGVIDRGARQGRIHHPEGLVDLFGRGVSCVVLEKLQDRGPLNGQQDPLLSEPCLFFF